jgi:hypothetical protein
MVEGCCGRSRVIGCIYIECISSLSINKLASTVRPSPPNDISSTIKAHEDLGISTLHHLSPPFMRL